MAKIRIVHDPYRNSDTTITEFAKAEGVPRYTVSHYFWWHQSLDGFRNRPAKGTGNGIKPHTYTHNGAFISIQEASGVAGLNEKTLRIYRDKYGINDIDAIRRHYDADHEKSRQNRLKVTEDGRKMTLTEYAKEQGVTMSAVTSWLYRKGTLKGFSTRGGSRVNPNLYRHSGMGVSKTMKEWTRHFKCTVHTIRAWLRTHDNDLKGFEKRRRRSIHTAVTYNGKRGSLSYWAQIFGVSYVRIYKYYSKHRTLKGFDPTRKQGRPFKAA